MDESIRGRVLVIAGTAALSYDDRCDKLLDAAALMMRPFHYDQGDIVTPRAGFGYEGVGEVHVVVRQRRLKRNRSGWGTTQYGKMADLLVCKLDASGTIISFWVEGFAYEHWSHERHGGPYRTKAAEAKSLYDTAVSAIEARKSTEGAGEPVVAVTPDAPVPPAQVEPEPAQESLPIVPAVDTPAAPSSDAPADPLTPAAVLTPAPVLAETPAPAVADAPVSLPGATDASTAATPAAADAPVAAVPAADAAPAETPVAQAPAVTADATPAA